MKFTVNAGEFGDALRSVQGRAKGATPIPILKHILVSGADGRVSVLGNDLDSSSFASLDAEVALPGSCAIPADPLIRVVGGLPKAAHIDVAQVPGTLNVLVKSGRSRYTIPVMDAADFPPALAAKDGFTFEATAEDLQQLFSRPSGVVDLKRLGLNGVFLHEDGGKLVSVATDTHSLLRFGTQIASDGLQRAVSPGHNGMIIPHASIAEILKIGAGIVSITERTIEITAGSRSYCSKLVDGTFPDYRRVIPAPYADHAVIDREALLESLMRLESIGTFSECGVIDATFADGEISIKLSGLASGDETIECETTGSASFCLQTSNLLGACKALNGEKIDMFVRGKRDPILIVDASEPDAICIESPCSPKKNPATEAA